MQLSFTKRLIVAVLITAVYFSTYLLGIIPGSQFYFFFGGFCCAISLTLHRGVRWSRNLLALVASISVTICFLDLTWRWLLRDWPFSRPSDFATHSWPPMPTLLRFDRNVRYEGRSFGDLAAMSRMIDARELRPVVFRTDAFGFPNAEAISSEPVDLIALGDSVTAGSFISQDRNLASLMKSRYHANTYNLSVDGVTPWHELLNLKVELPRLKHRPGAIVLWSIFTGNDLNDPFSDDMTPNRSGARLDQFLVSLSSFRNRSPIHRMAQAVTAPSVASEVISKDFLTNRKLLFYRPYATAATLTPEQVANHHNYGRLIRVMEEMARFAQANDLEVAVISVPTKEEVYAWVLNDGEPWTSDPQPSALGAAIREQCDRLGLAFLDLKPDLIRESRRIYEESQEILWWYDDTHWNERGNEVASTVVYKRLIQPIVARRSESTHPMAVNVAAPAGE